MFCHAKIGPVKNGSAGPIKSSSHKNFWSGDNQVCPLQLTLDITFPHVLPIKIPIENELVVQIYMFITTERYPDFTETKKNVIKKNRKGY